MVRELNTGAIQNSLNYLRRIDMGGNANLMAKLPSGLDQHVVMDAGGSLVTINSDTYLIHQGYGFTHLLLL